MPSVKCPTCGGKDGRWNYRQNKPTDCNTCYEVKYQVTLTEMGTMGDLARLF